MPITYAQSNRLLDYNFGGTSYTLPAKYWLALSTTAMQQDGTGCTEPTGNGYARVGIDNNKTTFSVAADGLLKNNIQVQFPESTGAWGTVTHIAIFDSKTAGNLLYYDALAESRIIETQTTLMFMSNTISIQLT